MSAWEVWGLVVQYLGNVLSVVLILAILSGRKEARATLGWVILVVFLPYFGAVAYLVFGRRMPIHLPPEPSDTPVCPLPPEGLSEPMERTAKLTSLAPARCRRLELLPDASEKYRRLVADIAAAKERVYLCYYVFRRDRSGRRLLEALAQQAAKGVDVRLLYDGWGAFGLELPGFLAPYRRQGVQARAFHPVTDPLQMSRINFRNHRKIAVIDGAVGYTGSTNVGDEYLGLNPRFGPWKDVHLRLEGAAAGALEQVFREDWRIATGEALAPTPTPADPGDTWVQVIPSGPNQRHDNLLPLLFAQFAAARETLDLLTPYLVPDYGLVAALRIAARQGVRVRIIVPGKSNHPMVAAAGRSYYDELLEGGVELYETRRGMLHAKGVLVDGRWAMVGSANLDNRSFHLNFELNLATSDPSFCGALGHLVDTWLGEAVPVTAEELGRRSLPRRLLEGACRTLSPVL
ncbi:MAG: cardiolipin synthase [Deferrisomatales bacterium]|nr:cardiolipin synthase [Deferrisomatales bacterium]